MAKTDDFLDELIEATQDLLSHAAATGVRPVPREVLNNTQLVLQTCRAHRARKPKTKSKADPAATGKLETQSGDEAPHNDQE